MKRKLWFLLAVIGIGLWMWIGSYVYFRKFGGTTITLSYPHHSKIVHIPQWAAPLTPFYTPLTAVDFWFTGERIQFGRFRIGTTANF